MKTHIEPRDGHIFEQLEAERDTAIEEQESQPWYCNKCGYFGQTSEHANCNYLAQPTRQTLNK